MAEGDSDSDDQPLGKRVHQPIQPSPAPAGKLEVKPEPSSSEEEMPDWIINHKAKAQKTVYGVTSSEDEDPKPDPSTAGPSGAGPSKPAAKDTPKGKAAPAPPAAKAALAPRAVSAVLAVQEPAPAATQEEGGSGQGNTQSQAAGQEGSGAAAVLSPGKVGAPLGISLPELPLMMPDKVPRVKMLMELSLGAEHVTALDLSGDIGAVGRVSVVRTAGASGKGTEVSEVLVDLKGVLFRTVILPLAGTAMVVNMGTTDAKVEAVFCDFVRLEEDSRFCDDEGLARGMGDLLGSDDDNYQIGAPGEEEKEGAKGKAAGKAASKAAGLVIMKARAKAKAKGKPKVTGAGSSRKKVLGVKGSKVTKRAAPKGKAPKGKGK